ncbi:MAG: hypothetical protein ACPGQV_19375 [Alphaproteobacteria bacterium]
MTAIEQEGKIVESNDVRNVVVKFYTVELDRTIIEKTDVLEM